MKMLSVEQRELEQWFLRITQYADELVNDLEKLGGWPEKVRTMQRNWIGRSEGTLVDFQLTRQAGGGGCEDHRVHHADGHHLWRDVDSTRAGTSAGCRSSLPSNANLRANVEQLKAEQRKAREAGDIGDIEKHGVNTGRYAINPFNGEKRADLGGELYFDGLRHGRHHERAGAR